MSKMLYRFLGVIDNLTAIRQAVAGREHYLIRPFNQAILMYPTAVLSLWSWLAVAFMNFDRAAVGRVWMWVLFANLMVLFFDLRFAKSVIIVFGLVILGFILNSFHVLGDVLHFFGHIEPEMNDVFYLLMAVIWAVVFLFVWFDRRSYVIVVEPNHVTIHNKWIGEAQSYPTENITITKEIGDAVELLLGFGTIKINNVNNGQVIHVIPHVFRVTAALDAISRVTAQFQVEEQRKP